MYQMLSIPQPFKCKSVLHIVDNREQTDEFKQYISQIACESHQILKLGESIIATPRFREFTVVMVHDTKTPHRFWTLLNQFNYVARLREVALHEKRLYVGVGNGAALLQKRMTLFRTKEVISGKDMATPQLGILKRRCIFHFDATLSDKSLLKQILASSMMDNYYLFPDGTGYTSHNKKYQGKVYLARLGRLYEIVSKQEGIQYSAVQL